VRDRVVAHTFAAAGGKSKRKISWRVGYPGPEGRSRIQGLRRCETFRLSPVSSSSFEAKPPRCVDSLPRLAFAHLDLTVAHSDLQARLRMHGWPVKHTPILESKS
jgi:hypothetical protein